jgi:hypothetical protein
MAPHLPIPPLAKRLLIIILLISLYQLVTHAPLQAGDQRPANSTAAPPRSLPTAAAISAGKARWAAPSQQLPQQLQQQLKPRCCRRRQRRRRRWLAAVGAQEAQRAQRAQGAQRAQQAEATAGTARRSPTCTAPALPGSKWSGRGAERWYCLRVLAVHWRVADCTAPSPPSASLLQTQIV